MKNLKKLSLWLFICFLGLSACRENLDVFEVDEQTPNPDLIGRFEPVVNNVQASLTGFVVDENEEPVAGASVKLGTQSTVTDEYGHFFFEDKTMNARGALVRIEKPGYFEGSRRFFPVAGQENRVKIELLTQNFDQSFQTNTGGKVSTEQGAEVNFEANSIQTEQGTPYQGTVQVAIQWLDPTSLNTLNQMPGDLQGVNLLNEEVALRTFGMLAVELKGASGEPLNIAKGKTATLSMPVPQQILGEAPAEIPLWSYNETYGLWVEEGKATLQGSNYVGEVSHFSFWNCDAPFELVQLKFQLQDENQQILPNYQTIILRSNGFAGAGYSNENGVVSGLVPQGEALTLKVLDICGEIIYSQPIGPFSTDTDLGVVTVNNSQIETTVIRGTVVGCEGETLDSTLVIAEFGGQTLYKYTSNGNFELVLSTCANIQEVKIRAVDFKNLRESEPVLVEAGQETDLGEISLCGQTLNNYIKVTVDGVTKIYPAKVIVSEDSTGNSGGNGFTFIQSISQNDSTINNSYFIGIGFAGTSPGDYTEPYGDSFLEGLFDLAQNWALRGKFSNFTVTEYGTVGKPIKGVFGGQLMNGNNATPVNVTGEFSVIRE